MSRRDDLAKGIQATMQPMVDQTQLYPEKKPDIPTRGERISPEELQQLREMARRAIRRLDDGIELLGCQGNAAGLLVPEEITPDDLKLLADTLFGFEEHIQLYIGDMLAASEKLAYGSYEQVAAAYSREATTLYKYKSVCSAVSIFLRRKILLAFPKAKTLTMTHYEYVMKFDESEQEKWLTAAAAENWSTRKLQAEIAKAQSEALVGGTTESSLAMPSGIPEVMDDEVREIVYDLSNLEDKTMPKNFNSLWGVAINQEYKTMTTQKAALVRKQIDDTLQWLGLLKAMLPK